MDTYSEIINEFNSTFSTNASLCEDLKVGWDLGDCRSFALYQLVEDQRSAPFGTVLYHHIGSYNIGEVYEAEGTAGFSFSSRLDSIEKFFPLSSNKATRNLEIGYRSPWLGGSCAFSSIPFKRWWVDSFKTLCANAPAQAELVGSFLMRIPVKLNSDSGICEHHFRKVCGQGFFEQKLSFEGRHLFDSLNKPAAKRSAAVVDPRRWNRTVHLTSEYVH